MSKEKNTNKKIYPEAREQEADQVPCSWCEQGTRFTDKLPYPCTDCDGQGVQYICPHCDGEFPVSMMNEDVTLCQNCELRKEEELEIEEGE